MSSNMFARSTKCFLRFPPTSTGAFNPLKSQVWMVKGVDGKLRYSTDSEYLHRSLVHTDHFQKSLPRLKIPELKDTCQRYLASQRVLQTDDEHSKTQTVVQKFLSDDGVALHKELVAQDKQNKDTSYISEPWYDWYLRDKRPVVLTHNPFMVFTDDPNPAYQTQLLRATNIIVSSLKFMKTYKAGLLTPDIFHLNPKKTDNEKFWKRMRLFPKAVSWYGAYLHKAYPLDMSQYPRLFNSTRIPTHDRDLLYTDESAKHILVMRNGHIYTFGVLDTEGNIVSPEVIMAHLKYIMNDTRPPPEYPIGILTTEHRDKWATIRSQLSSAGPSNETFFTSGTMNETYLRRIDSAVFALILDDHTPEEPNEITRTFLHGNGYNRWFDKSFSVILTKDGRAAVNFEHSWGDGVAVLRYFNEVWKDTTTKPAVNPETVPARVDSSNSVISLELTLDPVLKEYIKSAQSRFDSATSSLDLDHLEYFKFNKDYLKQQKVSPDAIAQLVIQLAFYRQYGKFAATYESCSTSAFKHGRTETMRPATSATRKTCLMFLDPKSQATVGELRAAINECSEMHKKLTVEAAMGQGFDRHLFAMKYLVDHKSSGPMPELFKDPAYAKINHIILSTSTLSSPAVVIGGFAAVTNDGYGIGYAVEDNRIGFNVTNYPPATNVHDFIDCVRLSLDDVYAVFEGKNPRS